MKSFQRICLVFLSFLLSIFLFSCDSETVVSPGVEGWDITFGKPDSGGSASDSGRVRVDDECGDDECGKTEDCANCPEDCGECVEENCGNGGCDQGESCVVCPEDCGECPDVPECGDGQCDADETCKKCPEDCGECPKKDPLEIVITSPPRGIETTMEQLDIAGYVTGGEPPYTFTLNDAPDGLAADNTFSGTKMSVHGMNVVKAQVKDSAGNSALAVHAFYYSEHYYPVDFNNPQLSMVKDGVMAFLGPEVWDDNDPSDLDDIASVIILFVQDQNLAALIPNPVTQGDIDICDYEVFIENVQWGNVDVDLIPVNGGLFAKIKIPDFKADIEVDLDGWMCPDIDGEVKIDSIEIEVMFFISADGNGGVQISCGETSVHVDDIDVELDNDILDFLIGWLINWFANEYADEVEKMFEMEIKNQINTTISQTIESLAWEQTMEIPLDFGMGEPIVLKAVLSISTVDFTQIGAIIGMQATVVSPKGTPHDLPGSISNAPCKKQSDGPFTDGAYKFEIGMYDDFLNQIPFALYWSGMLTTEIPPELLAGLIDLEGMGLDISQLYLDLLLPPIMTDCQKEDYMAQIGDLSADMTVNLMGQEIQMLVYASIEVALAFKVIDGPDGKAIGAEVAPSKVEVDVASVTVKDGTEEDAAALKAIIEALIGSQLATVFEEKIAASIPIPDIDLGGLHPLIPPGTKIKIDPQALERKWGYTVFSGDVYGTIELW